VSGSWSTSRTIVGGIAEDEVLQPQAGSLAWVDGKELVRIVCSTCGNQIGRVTATSDDSVLVIWSHTAAYPVPPAMSQGLVRVELGGVPDAAEVVPVACIRHGAGDLAGAAVFAALARARSRRRLVRLPVRCA
jgi:hypothetical protein